METCNCHEPTKCSDGPAMEPTHWQCVRGMAGSRELLDHFSRTIRLQQVSLILFGDWIKYPARLCYIPERSYKIWIISHIRHRLANLMSMVTAGKNEEWVQNRLWTRAASIRTVGQHGVASDIRFSSIRFNDILQCHILDVLKAFCTEHQC